MNTGYRFLEPLDVLFLRGNKLFGDPGSYGESLVPPWPSVAAGALRSRMLADDGIDLGAFARGEIEHPSLGKPHDPGPFTVTAFHLARRLADDRVEILVAPPADLIIGEDQEGTPRAQLLSPIPIEQGLASSYPLPLHPVLAEAQRGKPAFGYWLTQDGWRAYLRGETPTARQWVNSRDLWRIDPRVGVGLDTDTRRASDGKLFTAQAVAMTQQPTHGFDTGFLVAVAGAEPPAGGTVRLGGDGRGASIRAIGFAAPEGDYEGIARAGRCRLVLTTPGIFPLGWLPAGTTRTGAGGEVRFELHGVRARIVAASVARSEVVSGWDLARSRPKAAQRAAPAGSVYWLEDLHASEEQLRKLAERGLWNEPCEDTPRRAEGFNRLAFASWS